MPLCGFDEQMLEGLSNFYKGLAEAVRRKSQERKIPIEAAIILELKDMDDFLKNLVLLGNPLNKDKLLGITQYAKTFYLGALQQSKEKQIPIETAMENQIKETKQFLAAIDTHYYEHLEGKKEQPMTELVQWINGRFH